MIEIIVEVLGELLPQFLFEVLAEVGLHTFRRENSVGAVIAGVGYFVFGAVLGAVSLLIFRESLISGDTLRVLNLVITPAAVGTIMAFIGRFRAKRGKSVVGIERFFFGWVFAFSFALVRFLATS